MKEKLALLYVILFFGYYAQGQERDFEGVRHTNTIGVSLIGSIFIENDDIPNLSQSLPWGIEASWALNTYGNKNWQQAYNYPDIGAAFNFWNFKNDNLGKLYSASGFINFYPYRGKNNHLLLRTSFGVALISKPFTRDNNKNVAVGNTASYMIQGGLGYSFKLTGQWRINPHILFTHISNGGYVVPNLGLNLASIYLNVTHRIEEKNPDYLKVKMSDEWKEGFRINFIPAIAAKENDPPLGPKYIVLSATAYLDKRLARVSAVNAGFDFIYNRAVEAQIEADPSVNQEDPPPPLRMGALIGHELFINRFTIITQGGWMFWRPYSDQKSRFYVRLGFNYYLTKNVFLSLSLKTQRLDTSDYVRYGVGIRL